MDKIQLCDPNARILKHMNNEINILITAGGTREPIDTVRSITNKSSGKLGKKICEAIASQAFGDTTIYYVHGKSSVVPDIPLQTDTYTIKLIPADSTTDVDSTINNLTKDHKFQGIIHSMAISDYTTKCVTTFEAIFEASRKYKTYNELLYHLDELDMTKNSSKISSNVNDMTIILQKTPKIIKTLRQKAPGATIIGFKLLDNVTENELLNAAYNLIIKNGLDYCLANDLESLRQNNHTGYLMDKHALIEKIEGKDTIAETIAKLILDECQ